MSAKYLAITGGVGGAKLALGLANILSPDDCAFLVNTGDDFEHLGLNVSPDIDTLMYTLAGLNNTETGWGRINESWHFIETLRELGGESWFNLGDRDLAVHVLRTQALRAGRTLSEVTEQLFRRVGIEHPVFPMSNERVATRVMTPSGSLMFQHYFVRDRCEPEVQGFSFDGADQAKLTTQCRAWLTDPDLAGIIICPSNPFVSVDPILAVNDLRDLLVQSRVPVVAIAPIVAGKAIKGPTAKMMAELKMPATATAVAIHYGELLDGYILDQSDSGLSPTIEKLGVATIAVPTVMVTLQDRIDLAHASLQFIDQLSN